MSARRNDIDQKDPREGFTAVERACLDEARARWRPLTESQVSVIRRILGPVDGRSVQGSEAA